MMYFDGLLTCLALVLLVPTLVIFLQVIAACMPKKDFSSKHSKDDAFSRLNVAVLIPAHNESSGIVATLDSIKPQLKPNDRLIVVADNCTDDTASIAMTHGAEVVVRQDAARRGKGYALAYGVAHLSVNPPDVVVIVDADCVVEAHALHPIANFAWINKRPVQALYLMHARDANLKSKISEFAWRVKNWVRPLGCANLRLPCQLMGTGMAFPWHLIANADLANGNIVEDMKLGIDFSIAGASPLFYLDAKVTSDFPIASEVQSGQKTRWEHGHLSMILSEVPRLLVQGVFKLDKNLLAIAFDLLVPPLALLVVLIFSYAALSGVLLLLLNIGYFSFLITLIGMLILTVTITVAWWGWGRSAIAFSSLMMVPVYIVSKIPHYFKFLSNRQKTWNKTKRD